MLPADKSIAHLAIILSAVSLNSTVIENFPANNDCRSTLNIISRLGIKTKYINPARVIIYGRGLRGLKKPKGPLFIEESGTTFRLMLGLLAGQRFASTLSAGKGLSRRPMLRVINPLKSMGALITGKPQGGPPVIIKGNNLNGIKYKMEVASAQVKSAILLAALYARGKTTVIEPLKTRDHTERMLKAFKAKVERKGNTVSVTGGKELFSPGTIYIPADISSAAFFMVAAAIVPGSDIRLKGVSMNPTRLGVVKALKRMGADITIRKIKPQANGEPLGDIRVKSSNLKGVRLPAKEAPFLIDELPVLMVAAAYAGGRSVFEGVGELRIKETDRIRSMSENLKKMGADISVVKSVGNENIVIRPGRQLKWASFKSFGDHRTAMSMIVAGLAAKGRSRIDDVSCIGKSFPQFIKILKGIA